MESYTCSENICGHVDNCVTIVLLCLVCKHIRLTQELDYVTFCASPELFLLLTEFQETE